MNAVLVRDHCYGHLQFKWKGNYGCSNWHPLTVRFTTRTGTCIRLIKLIPPLWKSKCPISNYIKRNISIATDAGLGYSCIKNTVYQKHKQYHIGYRRVLACVRFLLLCRVKFSFIATFTKSLLLILLPSELRIWLHKNFPQSNNLYFGLCAINKAHSVYSVTFNRQGTRDFLNLFTKMLCNLVLV